MKSNNTFLENADVDGEMEDKTIANSFKELINNMNIRMFLVQKCILYNRRSRNCMKERKVEIMDVIELTEKIDKGIGLNNKRMPSYIHVYDIIDNQVCIDGIWRNVPLSWEICKRGENGYFLKRMMREDTYAV